MCTECWNRLEDFNRFYNAVDEAKNSYLNRMVKEEVPDATEMNADDEIVSVKSEPMDFDSEVWKSEPPQLEEVSIENLPPQSTFYEYEYENGEKYYCITKVVNDDRETQDSSIEENRIHTSRVVVLPKEIIKKPATNNGTSQISKDMSMTCVACDLPINTISELIMHYEDEHKEARIQVKCCETKLEINELLDHMEYHENPDKYR